MTTSPIMRYFESSHLGRARSRQVSDRFADLATWVDENLPTNAEKSTALRKLLEAKDAAVRASLDEPEGLDMSPLPSAPEVFDGPGE